jgi:hypothetical protein
MPGFKALGNKFRQGKNINWILTNQFLTLGIKFTILINLNKSAEMFLNLLF